MGDISISKSAGGFLFGGLLVLLFGAVRLYEVIQAGLIQGFGPNAVMSVQGKLAYHSISLRGELMASGLQVLGGIAAIAIGVWLVRRDGMNTDDV